MTGMAPRGKTISTIERFGPNSAAGLALAKISLLDIELAAATSDADVDSVRKLLVLAEVAAGTIEPVLVEGSLARGLEAACQQLLDSARYLDQNRPHYLTLIEPLRDSVRGLVAVAGSGNTRAGVVLTALLTASGVNAAMVTELQRCKSLAEEIEASHSQAESKLDRLLTDFDGRVDGLENSRAAEFDTIKKALIDAIEQERRGIVERGADLDREAERLLSQLRRTLSLAADGSLSVGYRHQADIEDKAANSNKRWSVGFGVAAVLGAVGAVVMQYVSKIHRWDLNPWAVVPGKLAAIAALGAIARYFAVHSSAHRNFAQQLRSSELELSNVGNFLAELDPTERAQVRRQLVPTFFGKPTPGHSDTSPTATELFSDLGK